MTAASRLLGYARFDELRRRIVRAALMPLFRSSDARLRQTANLSAREIRRILICRPNHRLGNLLLLTPLVAELQHAFPDAEVDMVLAGDDGSELFGAFDNVKHIHALSRRMVRHPVALIRTALRIRRVQYDLAIDPCESSQSSRLLVALANAKYVVGLPRDGASSNPGKQASMLGTPRNMAQWSVHLLRRALAQPPDGNREYPELDIRLSAEERNQARARIDKLVRTQGGARAPVIVGLFAEATGGKRYPRDWWQRFIAEVRVRRPDCAFVEILPPDGRSRLAMGLPTFAARSPRQVAAVISHMTCFVSADCGVMHLACASGTPTLGLFSVTEVAKYGPYGRGSLALATPGKTPEQIARLAAAHLERLVAAASGQHGPLDASADCAEHRPDPRGASAATAVTGAPITWKRS